MQAGRFASLLLLLPLAACNGALLGPSASGTAQDQACVTLPEGTYRFANGKFVSLDFEGDPEAEPIPTIDPGQWRGRIEDDLRQDGFDWMGLTVRGDVTLLTGTAPDEETKAEGIEAAKEALQSDDVASASVNIIVDAVTVEGEAAPAGSVVETLPDQPSLSVCQTAYDQLMESRRIEFTGNSSIADASDGLLDTISAMTLICTPYALEVASHTDARGAESYNQRLSQARANSIRDYLIEKGVDSGRLSAVGYGETQPIDTSQSSAAYARNRRTEFKLSRKSSVDE